MTDMFLLRLPLECDSRPCRNLLEGDSNPSPPGLFLRNEGLFDAAFDRFTRADTTSGAGPWLALVLPGCVTKSACLSTSLSRCFRFTLRAFSSAISTSQTLSCAFAPSPNEPPRTREPTKCGSTHHHADQNGRAHRHRNDSIETESAKYSERHDPQSNQTTMKILTVQTKNQRQNCKDLGKGTSGKVYLFLFWFALLYKFHMSGIAGNLQLEVESDLDSNNTLATAFSFKS